MFGGESVSGGTLIRDIEELKDGESYVCASFEKFIRIKYGLIQENGLTPFSKFMFDDYVCIFKVKLIVENRLQITQDIV